MNTLLALPYELLYEIFTQALPEVEAKRHTGSDPLLYIQYAPALPHPVTLQAECLRILTICKALSRIVEEFLYTDVYLRPDPVCLDRFVSSAGRPSSSGEGSGPPRGEYTREIRMERLDKVNSTTARNLVRLKELCPNLTAIATLGRLGLGSSPGPEIWLKNIISLDWSDIELNSIVHRYLSSAVDTLQSLSLRGACGGTLSGALVFNRLTKLSLVFYSAPLPTFLELRAPNLEWLRLNIQYRAKDGALSEFLTNNGRNLTFLCIDNARHFYSTGKLVETFTACPRLEIYMEDLMINRRDLDPTCVSCKHTRLRQVIIIVNMSPAAHHLLSYKDIFTSESFPALQSVVPIISNRLATVVGGSFSSALTRQVKRIFPHLSIETKLY